MCRTWPSAANAVAEMTSSVASDAIAATHSGVISGYPHSEVIFAQFCQNCAIEFFAIVDWIDDKDLRGGAAAL